MNKNNAWRRTVLVLVSGLAISLVTGAAPAPKGDIELGFFGLSRGQFFATYRKVALLPVDVPAEFGDHSDMRHTLEDAVTKYLQLAKFEVVPSQRYVEFFDRFNRELGGIYHPRTGDVRAEVEKKVVASARGALLDAEHPDGFVRMIVTRKMAAIYGHDLRWDGVRERSFGNPPKKGDGWKPVRTLADLAAISLHLEFFRTPDKTEFRGEGGIQPLAYVRDVEGLGVTALAPPREDLLKDLVRLDRAARAATQSLRYTPLQFAKAKGDPDVDLARMDPEELPPLPEALHKPESPLLKPREEILKSVHRVAIAALHTGDSYPGPHVGQRVRERIHAELAPLGWDLVDVPQASELLVREIVAKPLFDPYTGKPNEAGFSAARKAVFQALKLDPKPDAILWTKLVHTIAMQRDGNAMWDGASQNAVTLGAVENLGTLQKLRRWWSLSVTPDASSIRAVSLEALLSDPNDEALYRGRGGVALEEQLHRTEYGSSLSRLRFNDVFNDQSRLDNSVNQALRYLVLPEAPSRAENAINP